MFFSTSGGCHLHHLCRVTAVYLHAVPALPGPTHATQAAQQLCALHQRGGEFGNRFSAQLSNPM